MTMHLSRAFVLSSADYRETSRLVQMFCQNEGRISLIAKGIRSAKSPKAQLLDGFNLLQVKYNLKDGETLGLLTGLEVEKVFGSIRADLSAYARASYWFEIIKIAAQGRLASPAIFATTEKFLTAFEHDAKGVSPDQATSESMFTGFLITLCEQLGFGLHLHNCGNCGANEPLVRIDLPGGNLLCPRCAGNVSNTQLVDAPVLQFLKTSAQGHAGAIRDRATFIKSITLLNRFLEEHLEHRLRSFEFLKTSIDR